MTTASRLDHFGNSWIFDNSWQQLAYDVIYLAMQEAKNDNNSAHEFIHNAPAFELLCEGTEIDCEHIRARVEKPIDRDIYFKQRQLEANKTKRKDRFEKAREAIQLPIGVY